MSQTTRLPAKDVLTIDDICDRFEEELRSNRQRPLRSYLVDAAGSSGALKTRLAENLLLVEWDYLLEQSREPRLEDFIDQDLLPPEAMRELYLGWRARRGSPKLFAGFELLKLLGQGRFGSVWKAKNLSSSRLVALKI